MMKVAVIGAGMAGLTAARHLQSVGRKVTVFDKSKGTGGRLASRSVGDGWVDHGAPYFSADHQPFREELAQNVPPAALQLWNPRVKGLLDADEQVHFIGVPRNSAVTRNLLGSLSFQPSTRIGHLEKSASGWQLYNDGESLLGTWQQVIVAAPAPQTLALVRDYPSLAENVRKARMEPSWVAAVQTAELIESLAEVTIDPHPALRRITLNSAKPGRGNSHLYLLQAAKDWSIEHLEEAPEEVGRQLEAIFTRLTASSSEATVLFTHRWRYAFTEQAVGKPCLWDADLQLGACGDWCLGRRVEDAWQSGYLLARQMGCWTVSCSGFGMSRF
ncbi:MAG: NAD(P)-binding protein [Desulfuromonadales bacterium]|nr:NAD(P)-binding protein [Desulfuromonadales bacterium]MBN2792503.1 NAD(P)-binding protein [Desulfuromonadales bacterium]